MVILLVVMVPTAALGTPAAQQGGNFLVAVAGTAVGSIPHQIDLKVTQLPGGQLSEVTGFIVGPEEPLAIIFLYLTITGIQNMMQAKEGIRFGK